MYADATGRPSQFAALHFHTYVWDSNVVDIMPHPGTSAETIYWATTMGDPQLQANANFLKQYVDKE